MAREPSRKVVEKQYASSSCYNPDQCLDLLIPIQPTVTSALQIEFLQWNPHFKNQLPLFSISQTVWPIEF